MYVGGYLENQENFFNTAKKKKKKKKEEEVLHKDFFSKCDQIRSKLRIWSHLLKKCLMEIFIFCAVQVT